MISFNSVGLCRLTEKNTPECKALLSKGFRIKKRVIGFVSESAKEKFFLRRHGTIGPMEWTYFFAY